MSNDKSFGELLRAARNKAFDDERDKRLTQGRLGELIGQELWITAYTATMVSYWESNKNQIHKDDRSLLVSLIKVLHECGGLPTANEANELLRAGNYRTLNAQEQRKIFGMAPDVPSDSHHFGHSSSSNTNKSFGTLLRAARNKAFDHEKGKRLTQERLGELIGHQLGTMGYTGVMVSYWENDKIQIHKDDWDILVSLIKVLHECGGLPTANEANELLRAGDYRALNAEEERKIFGARGSAQAAKR